MDTHDEHEHDDLAVPGGEHDGDGPPGHDRLEPIRDLLDPVDGPLVTDPSEPSEPDPIGELPDLAPILDDLEPPPAADVEAGPEVDTPAAPYDPRDASQPPVSLDVDGPADLAPDGPPPAGPVHDEVDLSLDDDLELDDTAPEDAGEPAAGEVELPMPPPTEVDFDVPDSNSFISTGLLSAALAVIGASATAGLLRTKRTTPPDLAAHLETLGIDARVEHLDLVGLDELLARGGTVLLSTDGSAGVDQAAVAHLESIDHADRRIALRTADGGRRTVELASFEPAWADSANQVVLASGPSGDVALVPVVLSPSELTPAR